jgi:very-short-patch-repair endonuclease
LPARPASGLSTFPRRCSIGWVSTCCQGETGASLEAPREGPLSARLLRRAIMNSDDESPRARGRRLRAASTPEERKLWRQLRAKRFGGFKFRRQHRIGPYFADLCCLERRLIIELDGGQHTDQEEKQKVPRERLISQSRVIESSGSGISRRTGRWMICSKRSLRP